MNDTEVLVCEQVRKEFRDADRRLEVLSGVGHIPQLERPDAFNALLVRTLTTLPRVDSAVRTD